ncbi:MAG TPA: hypothetical protein VGF86_14075 [Candidatus Tumulicola sp.]|jgi:hypothetical protein
MEYTAFIVGMPPIQVTSAIASTLIVAMGQDPGGLLTIPDVEGTTYKINSRYIVCVRG